MTTKPTTPSPATVLELTGESTPLRRLLSDLWKSRSLMVMLARQNFHTRYRSATLGVLWSVLLPLVQGGVLAFVFTHIIRIHSTSNYPVSVFSAMALWSYFATSLTDASTSIIDSSEIATKVYFPRLMLPMVGPMANVIGLCISLCVVVSLGPLLSVYPKPSLLLLPVVAVAALALVMPLGALATLIHVYYRDARYIVLAMLLVWFYGTPVVYPLELAGRYRSVLEANPMTGIVQLGHFAIFGKAEGLGLAVTATCAWIFGLTLAAALAYRRYERVAVDRL